MNPETIVDKAEESLYKRFSEIDKITEYNQKKVLNAFYNNKIGEEHFYTVTGYGHDDLGREALDKVFAAVIFVVLMSLVLIGILNLIRKKAIYWTGTV